MPKRNPITINPANKGVTRKRVGVSKKTGKIKRSDLRADLAKQKRAVQAAPKGSAKRAAAAKRSKQDNFALVFGKKRK